MLRKRPPRSSTSTRSISDRAAPASSPSQQTASSLRRPRRKPRKKPRVEIEYCPRCRWLLRAAWMAQELLTTFEADLGEVALAPSETSGTFEVRVDDRVLFSRSQEGRFPESKELKQLVRDRVAPSRDLGHSDRAPVGKPERR